MDDTSFRRSAASESSRPEGFISDMEAEEDAVNPPCALGSANSKPIVKELPRSTNRILLLRWQEESNSTVLEMARANSVKIGASKRIQSRDTTTGGLVIHVVSMWTIKVISARTGNRGIKTVSPAITTRSLKEWGGQCAKKGCTKRNFRSYEGAAQ